MTSRATRPSALAGFDGEADPFSVFLSARAAVLELDAEPAKNVSRLDWPPLLFLDFRVDKGDAVGGRFAGMASTKRMNDVTQTSRLN